jgi:hypothetical protein
MKPIERDLLILLNESDYSEAEIEREAMLINKMLITVETDEHMIGRVEVLDYIHSRIIRKHKPVMRLLKKKASFFRFYLHKN